jgi:CO dehydrogenase maturation factor
MGLFHCPMGAAFYDDEDCILCEMCSATTEEEMIEASKRIRAYLQSVAPRSRPVRKIAVCGKGGVGKSTVVTLMADVLAAEGYSTLVLDTDESNPGLHRMFGFDEEPKPLITVLSRFALGQEGASDTEWLGNESLGIGDIPSEYILNRDRLKFMMIGKIEDPFQGCACSMADMTRNLMEKLALEDKEVVLIDMEAGVESFGRGMERGVDTVLMIVEPSFESVVLAEKIAYMAEGMGISRARAILNKVPTEKVRQKLTEELDKKKIRAIGTVYFNDDVNEAGFEGTALGDSKAKDDVKAIVDLLLKDEAAVTP